jgi:transcriptional regulator with XRE-family HTH domain
MPRTKRDAVLREAAARVLGRLRTRARLTQLEVCKKTDISLRHITNLEKGNNNPGLENLDSYLQAVGASWPVFARELEKERRLLG